MLSLALCVETANPDKVKKHLPCLGCGKPMWTDRCHRICGKCHGANRGVAQRAADKVLLGGHWERKGDDE